MNQSKPKPKPKAKPNAKPKAKHVPLPETQRLLDIVKVLRKKCPWDRKQTHQSLIPYLIEESYETVDAIEKKSVPQLREELGDVLLQIVLHAEIGREKKKFEFEDVAKAIADKMVHRHPHIFSDAKVKTVADQMKIWSKMKAIEKPNKTLLEGIPRALPALQLAQRYGDIAASVGFDWDSVPAVMDKVHEEFEELKAEIARKPQKPKEMEMELGDLLFVLTRLAAHLGLDAEAALRKSSAKFEARFSGMEKQKKREGKSLADCNMDELEASWKKMKDLQR